VTDYGPSSVTLLRRRPGRQAPIEQFRPFIVLRRVYGKAQFRPPPDKGGKRTVKEKEFGMIVEIGTDVFPFRLGTGFPFGPEQGFRSYGFHARAVGKAAVTGIIGVKGGGFLIEIGRGIRKNKGVVPRSPDYPIGRKPADGKAVTGKHVLFRPGNHVEPRFFRQGRKRAGAIGGTGKNMAGAGYGFEGFHNPDNERLSFQGKEGFSRKAA
jgi:hypothetical protein